jgi:predicted permease
VAFSVAWHARRERATDRQRDARLIPATGLGLDVRFAMRLLRRRPAATGAVVLTLGLALGSSTALFSVVNAWVLTPLPYAEPDRLVVVWETLPAANIDQNTPAPAVLSMWRDRATQLDAVAALRRRTRNLTGLGDPARLTEIVVEPAMLSFLGVRAEVGRLFGADEARAPAPRVVVLSHAAWQQRFGGAPDVLGQFLTLDGEAHEVIGVMPSHVRPLGFDADIWAPLAFTPDEWENENRFLWVLGRLAPGATVESASAEIDALARERSDDSAGGRVVSLSAQTLGDTRAEVLVLFGASAFVLLVACANVASLTLAQMIHRRREMTARQALGASRGRLVRQVVVESLTIGGLGGALGLAIAVWATRALVSLAPAAARLGSADVLSWQVFLFLLATTATTAVLFGLLPAWHSGRGNLAAALRGGGRGGSASRQPVMAMLVAAEIAVTLVLLIAVGLVTRSFLRMTAVDLGFDPAALVLAELPRPADGDVAAFYAEVDRQLGSTPGITGVAMSQGLPLLAAGSMGSGFVLEGQAQESAILAYWRSINPGYFRTLGIPMVAGRALSDDDRAGSPSVAVVSASFARRAWPDDNAVGKRIGWGSFDEPITVVGVAADARQSRAGDLSPHVYMPYRQIDGWPPSQIAIRSTLGGEDTASLIRRVVRDVDPAQPVVGVRTASQQLWVSMGRRRFHLVLFGILASIAATLALVGLYAMLSFALSEQRRDLGIRAALGATPGQLGRLWWWRGGRLVAAGVVCGLAVAWWSGGLIEGFLFGVEPTDPVAVGASVLFVVVTAAVACWLPARRAGVVDPIETLRGE